MRKLVKVVMGLTIGLVLSTGVCFAEWMICTPAKAGVVGGTVQVQVTDCNVNGREMAFMNLQSANADRMLATILTAITLKEKISIHASGIDPNKYSIIDKVFVNNN